MMATCIKISMLLGLGIFGFLKTVKRTDIPDHLLRHNIIYEKHLIEPETAKGLNKIVREMGQDEVGYPTQIAADLKTGVGNILHKHIGEA